MCIPAHMVALFMEFSWQLGILIPVVLWYIEANKNRQFLHEWGIYLPIPCVWILTTFCTEIIPLTWAFLNLHYVFAATLANQPWTWPSGHKGSLFSSCPSISRILFLKYQMFYCITGSIYIAVAIILISLYTTCLKRLPEWTIYTTTLLFSKPWKVGFFKMHGYEMLRSLRQNQKEWSLWIFFFIKFGI